MKILYFSPHPNLGLNISSGPGTHMREVIGGFRDAGHQVETLIMGGEEELQTESASSAKKGLKEKVKPFIPAYLWQSMKDSRLIKFDGHVKAMLLKKVVEFQPDLIYERGYYMMTSGVQVAQATKTEHFLEMNAPYPEEKIDMEGKSVFDITAIEREKYQVDSTDHLVVVSSALKEYYINKCGIPEEKVLVTPNAINTSIIPEENPSLKQELFGNTETLIVGFVGSIFPYHGVDLLIKAFAKWNYSNSKLLVVGDGATLEDLKNLTVELGIDNRVVFTGSLPHSQAIDHIQAMDITVMAKSNWYGSPVKIFEYGALGKVVIAPNNVPVRDVMDNGVHGLLIEGEDELLDAFNKLGTNQKLRSRLARNWEEEVLAEHTWKKVTESILSCSKQ